MKIRLMLSASLFLFPSFIAFATGTDAATAVTKSESSSSVTVPFDHLSMGNEDRTTSISVAPGDSFTVSVTNTCSSLYRLQAVDDLYENEGAETAAKALKESITKTDEIEKTLKEQETNLGEQLKTSLNLHQDLLVNGERYSEFKTAETSLALLVNNGPLIITDEKGKPLSDDSNAAKVAKETTKTKSDFDAAKQKESACVLTDKPLTVTIKHQKQFTGYIIKIVRIDGKPDKTPVTDTDGNVQKPEKDLYPVELIVNVTASPWNTTFSGGVTASGLTDKKYSLSSQSSSGSYSVQRDAASEDSAALGLAAFVTVSNINWQLPIFVKSWGQVTPGFSFGIGTNSSTRLEYYPGVSLMAGPLVVTAGANIGAVNTLPAGLSEGSTTTNANALSNLPTHIGYSWFAAISFTFLGSQDKFTGAISPAGATTNKVAAGQ